MERYTEDALMSDMILCLRELDSRAQPNTCRVLAKLATDYTKQLADAQATVEALQREKVAAHERAYQEGHPSPCTLGSLCPYCEIERRAEQLTQLQALVRALPCFDGEIKVKTFHHESDHGQGWDEYECGDAGFDNLEAANVYAALLQYRATLDATTPAGGQNG